MNISPLGGGGMAKSCPLTLLSVKENIYNNIQISWRAFYLPSPHRNPSLKKSTAPPHIFNKHVHRILTIDAIRI